MRMVDIIARKRNGSELSETEIDYFISHYMKDEIPDYQVSALMMAIYYKGMSGTETASLTKAMVESGDTIDLSPIKGHKVDKHSTGGVGDKTTFIVGPLVAAAGIPVAKMSGRGLGHTGGTIDKLEAIPGFQVELSNQQFIDNVNQFKLAVVGQTGNLAPADKKLYALRDVTATVDSIPLIASSIMSKKIASGANGIVLDVKTGSGAFMKSLEDSKRLAKEMVTIGSQLGRNTVAVISDMNQPLGYEIGNANEVKEAIEVLQGRRVEDLRELAIELAAHMTLIAGIYRDYNEATEALAKLLDNGKAYESFYQFVKAQSGDTSYIEDLSKLSSASHQIEVKAEEDGYVHEMEADEIGLAAMHLGAGRAKKEDKINHGVGITLRKKIADQVKEGDTLAILYSDHDDVEDIAGMVKQAYTIKKESINQRKMIYEVIK
ncbi:pyrimidine-nucleoside phosphorylase [Gracilibacillus caseinilyticus]|uniref:Pyrimidine-nucleoside phosphorylase n=1 Tax=Gracilibacillus caseinilyticus TaxID=2932256 RepID=A0ABY4ESY1_9BACI|nr:pyrimidine-nucleoside phosphorylase [Gracilibacillus caseinilyticus]UOQ47527.1 pyrimidine-nucleoside phosphorylase [Gracilibacillus caseinilyticus]